jgi:diacylglycerol kinase (ATP)
LNQVGRLLRRLTAATGYSLKGLRTAWRYEFAFRLEAVLAGLLAPLAFVLSRDGVELALLLGSLLLVLIVELLNTAVEALVDRGGADYDDLAGRAKDAGSAAVFLCLLLVALVWGLVLGARLASA